LNQNSKFSLSKIHKKMLTRFTILFIAIATLFSCQTIMRHSLGIKNPEMEKEKTVNRLTEKKKIANAHFLKKEKVFDAYVGSLPKVYVFDKQGYQVIIPNCYELIQENIRGLLDTIPNKLSAQSFRDNFVQETIQIKGDSFHSVGTYDYEVFFYWSLWLGKFNIKKLLNAQKTVDALNQGSNSKKIILIPLNFDFIKESGWTEESVEAEMSRIIESQKKT